MAGAPVTDWKNYDSIYTERYMGTPKANPKGYETSSPLQKAAQLEADLLLIHGSADDNVHLANTMAFVSALIKAGRPYSLQRPPAAAPRVPAEGGPHRAGPRGARPLRADAPGPPRRSRPRAFSPASPPPGRRRSRFPKAARNRSSSPRTPHEASAGTATATSPPRARQRTAVEAPGRTAR